MTGENSAIGNALFSLIFNYVAFILSFIEIIVCTFSINPLIDPQGENQRFI
jgi:hypothetical protein